MDYNEQESGMTLGEIFKVIFKKKWLLLAITLGVAIVGTLFINFVISKNQIEYKSEFTLSYPGIGNAAYPDGTPFSYGDIVSIENLAAVKDSNKDFADVDISSMAEKNDISVKESTRTVNNEEVATGKYTLTVKSKYFPDAGTAKNFVTALVSYPVEYAKSAAEKFDYTANLRSYLSSNAYGTQLDYLVAQINMLTSGYDSLIGQYGGMFEADGKQLNAYRSEITQYFNNNKINTLYTELDDKGYVKDTDYLYTVNQEIRALEIEQEYNKTKIENLKTELTALVEIYGNSSSAVVTYESFNSRIAALTERNVDIDRELEILDNYIKNNSEGTSVDSAERNAFEAKLDKYYKALTDFTTTYTSVNKSVYHSVSRVTFTDASVITSEGGISLIITVIGTLLGGFVVGCIVNLIIDMPKYLREKKEALKKREETADAEQ